MRKRIGLAAIVALLVVVWVVAKDASRQDARFTIVSGPPDPVSPFVLPPTTHFEVRSTGVKGKGQVLMQVGTYLRPPADTVTVTVLGAGATRIARCVFPASAYHDNSRLSCSVPDLSQVRSLQVVRSGHEKLAMISHERIAGYLAADEQTSFSGRVSTVLSRIATPLPNGIGSTVALVGLFVSVASTLLVLLLSIRLVRTERSTSDDGNPWFYSDPNPYLPDATHHHPHHVDDQPGIGLHPQAGGDAQPDGASEQGASGGHHSGASDSGSTSSGDSGGGADDSGGGGGDSGGGGGDN